MASIKHYGNIYAVALIIRHDKQIHHNHFSPCCRIDISDAQPIDLVDIDELTRNFKKGLDETQKALHSCEMDHNKETLVVVIIMIALIVVLSSAGKWYWRNPRLDDPLA